LLFLAFFSFFQALSPDGHLFPLFFNSVTAPPILHTYKTLETSLASLYLPPAQFLASSFAANLRFSHILFPHSLWLPSQLVYTPWRSPHCFCPPSPQHPPLPASPRLSSSVYPLDCGIALRERLCIFSLYITPRSFAM